MATNFRFSKLFLSHLDAEFKKQSIPSLKSLIADQVSITFGLVWFVSQRVVGSLKASKYTEQYVITARIDPNDPRIFWRSRSILR
jgi:hypothetical protein